MVESRSRCPKHAKDNGEEENNWSTCWVSPPRAPGGGVAPRDEGAHRARCAEQLTFRALSPDSNTNRLENYFVHFVNNYFRLTPTSID